MNNAIINFIRPCSTSSDYHKHHQLLIQRHTYKTVIKQLLNQQGHTEQIINCNEWWGKIWDKRVSCNSKNSIWQYKE